MKKVIASGIIATLLTAGIVSQTSYACFCIKGIIWEKGCDQLFSKTTPKPTAPTTPTPTPTPTQPVDTPVQPSTPIVKTASTVTKTPVVPVTPNEVALPQTGATDSIIALASLGGVVYAGAYAATRLKRQ